MVVRQTSEIEGVLINSRWEMGDGGDGLEGRRWGRV